MEMTFDGYINNPMGRKNFVYSNRLMYKELYHTKIDKLLVREVGKVNFILYIDKVNDMYYCHMKVPSEVVPNFYYDTIVQFYTNDKHIANSRNLKNYSVKFYSNDPSFVFTFAHAMLSNNVFIRDLLPRMSKEAVKNAAKERNPKDEVGYVKSIYFAYILMGRYSLFDKIQYETYGAKYNQKELLNNIEHADKKIRDRQELGEAIQKDKAAKKREAKRTSANTIATAHSDQILTDKIKNSPFIKNVIKTKTISKVSNNIKKTKRI